MILPNMFVLWMLLVYSIILMYSSSELLILLQTEDYWLDYPD